jgi:hypothetical protein
MLDFLEGVPTKVAAEIHAVLQAVAEAPPPSFSGGGKWEAAHGHMAGFYEIRLQGGGKNHRLFCLLDRGEDLGGPSAGPCSSAGRAPGSLPPPASSASRQRP